MQQEAFQHPSYLHEIKRKAKSRAFRLKNARRITSGLPQKLRIPKVDDQATTFDGSVLSCQSSTTKGICPSLEPVIESPQEETKKATQKSQAVKPKALRLYFENSKKYQNFKLFREEDVPISLGKFSHKRSEDPVCDDDCMTEDEQIKSAARKINNVLREGITEYLVDRSEVENIRKYRKKRRDE